MNVMELAEQLRKTNPNLMRGFEKNRAEALIRNVFKQMNDTLAGTEEGIVSYGGLGRFRVKKVEREVKGTKTSRTQIVFLRAELGGGKGAAGAGAEERAAAKKQG